MREFDFIPSVCNETDGVDGAKVPPTYAGKIVLRTPTNGERFRYLDAVGIDIKGDGTADMQGGSLITIAKMIDVSKAHYKSVDLKSIDGETVFKSFDDLDNDPEGMPIQVEVARAIFHGVKPAKNLKPS